jgi:tRNA(Ile)-lysidine synthase
MESHESDHRLIEKTGSVLRRLGLGTRPVGVVVGVSGGPDSMALLHILIQLRAEPALEITVAHLDHRLRPESGDEAAFVERTAKELGADPRLSAADVAADARSAGISIEEAGRRARYAFFEEVRCSVGADFIATAHHLDDQAETVLLRLLRGSSLTGLTGMSELQGRLLRPFARTPKSEIVDFLDSQGIPYVVDPSNLLPDTDRNYMRHYIIPQIEERFPSYAKTIARSADLLVREDTFIEQSTDDLVEKAVRFYADRVVIDRGMLADVHPVLIARLVRRAVYSLAGPTIRLQMSHLDAATDLVRRGAASAVCELPSGYELVNRYGETLILNARDAPACESFSFDVTKPGVIVCPGTGRELRFEILDRVQAPLRSILQNADQAVFDAGVAPLPLTVRSPLPGDRIKPWGMTGSAKLKNIFIDRQIPVEVRHLVPVLVKDDEILWIAGIRRGRAAPVTDSTGKVLRVTYKGESSPGL